MITKANLKNYLTKVCFAVFVIGLISSCAPKTSVFSQNGWSIEVDARNEVLTVNHEDLGLVIKDIRLGLIGDKGFSTLSKWSVKSEKEALTIHTKEPEPATWKFEISGGKIDIRCSANNAHIQGTAPAPESRIPARVESQDNGIMYTSLGLVSSRNIYSLFDRETDTLIQFPRKSILTRNPADKTLMDVDFPATEEAALSLIPDYYINVL